MRRVLKHNATTRTPLRHVVVDTETLPQVVDGRPAWQLHTLRLGCATYLRFDGTRVRNRVPFAFTTVDAFWEWLRTRLSRDGPLVVWAHNLGFDLTVLRFWERLEEGEFAFEGEWQTRARGKPGEMKTVKWAGMLATEDPPSIAIVRHSSGAIVKFLDSLNWWRESLSSLGSKLGLAKLPMPKFEAPDEEWWTYCRRDAEVLEKAVTTLVAWVRDNDYGAFKLTAPGQAMAAYRHRFMRHTLISHDWPVARKVERSAFYNGQVELYFRGRVVADEGWRKWAEERPADRPEPVVLGPVHHLDVTSLFASVMRHGRFPCILEGIKEDVPPDQVAELLRVFVGIAHVEIGTDHEPFPRRTAEGTEWCKGTFDTYLAGDELLSAVRLGVVRRAVTLCLYSADRIFADYVRHFWGRRRAARQRRDTLDEEMTALFLKALWGKFGRWAPPWVDLPGKYGREPWGVWPRVNVATGEVEEFRSIAHHMQLRQDRQEHPEAMPCIAACVAAAARERMRALRAVAGERAVLYQATDSLYVTDDGLRRLKEAGEVRPFTLGKLRLIDTYKEAEFRGLNTYRVGDTWVRAGVKESARLKEDGLLHQVNFDSLNTILSREPLGGVLARPAAINPDVDYPRGCIGPDGWISPKWVGREVE